jgi:hypothetical protein
VLGGLGLMRINFWLGVIVTYLGFVLLLREICIEPVLLTRPLWIQVAAIVAFFIALTLFCIKVVFAQAPIDYLSFAMRNGSYAAGTSIAGIEWDDHLTDLRVAVINPSNDDYDDLDVSIQPNTWTYRAALLDGPLGCELTPIGFDALKVAINKKTGSLTMTATRTGDGLTAEDSAGNIYTELARPGGYRLRCNKIPSKYSINVVFAEVSLLPELVKNHHNDLPKGWWGITGFDIKNAKSIFDLFDVRPFPATVTLNGKYVRKMKSFTVDTVMCVREGN